MRFISMKILTLLFLILFPLLALSQPAMTASNESGPGLQAVNDFVSAGHLREAVHAFEHTVSELVRQGRQQELPQQYFTMAFMLALNGNYKESIRYHKKAIKSHRKYRNDEPLEISINLGLTYQLAGREKKARKILGAHI